MKIAVTGANGYLGGRVAWKLEQDGHDVVRMARRPADNTIGFHLETADVIARTFSSLTIDTLVHCAWDMTLPSRSAARAINVEGSRALVQAARNGGCRKLIFVSTMSAFQGCQSVYGETKAAVEEIFRQAGGTVVRPGLIWGPQSGGMTGTLSRLSATLPVIPVVGGGSRLYLVHEGDLTALMSRLVASSAPPLPFLTAAHGQAVFFRDILRELARRAGRSPVLVPVPSSAVWAGLKIIESLNIHLPLRSDSLIGLLHTDPAPIFADAWLHNAGFGGFRPFEQAI